MTPFAVVQRAARLAPELDKLMAQPGGPINDGGDEGPTLWSTEMILRALYAAGLTLDADLALPSTVKLALDRLTNA